MKNLYLLLFLLPFSIIMSCSTSKVAYISQENKTWELKQLPERELSETVFLIGDGGKNYGDKENPVLEVLKKDLEYNPNSSLIFLGDNIYPSGLREKAANRKTDEKILGKQLSILEDYKGNTYFIPGNHDWNKMRSGGLESIKRQEKFIESYYEDRENIFFLPDNGCGDPVKIKEDNKLIYIFIDSQWWLQDWEKEKDINKGCEIKSRQAFIDEIHEMVLKNKNKQIVIFMHHPFFSNGSHGGYFSAKEHLFPLTAINDKAYIPLPIVGSIHPAFCSLTGRKQDIVNTHYQELKEEILEATHMAKNAIFVAGHEHGLQYSSTGNQHFIISGAGSKVEYMKKGNDVDFVASNLGYAKLYYYENKEVWLEFITIEDNSPKIKFRKKIVEAPAGSGEDETVYPKLEQDSFRVAANKEYDEVSGIRKIIMGKQHRELWGTEITARVIDLEKEKGGLIPIKKGGGTMSNSLRLETKEGKQYVLRSVDKYLYKVLPEDLRKLKIASSILKDQTTTMHPFSALVLPPLAEAAGIYYHKPELVYLKHQNGLGAYNELFEEGLYLLEARASGDRSDLDNLGNSTETMGYIDVVAKQNKSTKHKIDQEWTLRSRLFDNFIHDWDRHDDNWRWATFEKDDNVIYRPIPRDRDQVFYEINGFLPTLVSKILVRKLRPFRHDIKDVRGFNFNARNFDRYYLNDLDWNEWEKIVEDLKSKMTDDVIETAFEEWPIEIQEKNSAITIEKLKSRRNNLDKIAWKLYKFISKEVEVRGTDKKELFEIEHLDNGNVHVKAFKSNKKGEKKEQYYDRLFSYKETKEIRIYGLGGKDKFIVSGNAREKIRLRIIGGEGKDILVDSSKGKRTIAHDDKDGMEIEGKVKDERNNKIDNNSYDRLGFSYDSGLPIIILGSSRDDGFWFGAGATIIRNGFRKSPYKRKQSFSVSTAPGTRGTFKINYEGDFIEAVGALDFHLDLSFLNPTYINFYGLSNDNEIDESNNSFHWIRMKEFKINPSFKKRFGADKYDLKFGPILESVKLINVENRILDDSENFAPIDFERDYFSGGSIEFTASTIDNLKYPKQGSIFNIDATQRFGLNNEKNNSGLVEGSATAYFTLGTRVEFIFANRTGGAYTWGNPEFYQMPSIGNSNYLRGFHNDRFRGQKAFYNNTDLRIKLVYWNNKILPMEIGILGGFDIAKVWVNGESSNKFHKSYTAGIWLSPLKMLVINPHMSFSEEGRFFTFKLGFNF